MIVALALVLLLAVAAVQQRLIWLLQKQIRTLAECMALLNEAMKQLKSMVGEPIIQPDRAALDRIHAIVFAEIAAQLEADDEDDDEPKVTH